MAKTDDETLDFFISYHHTDREWAEWIAWTLEEDGWSVLLQAWDFRAGQNFIGNMDEGVARAKRTLAVLSPDYVTSPYCRAEWQAAFAQDPGGAKRIFLPVRVRDFRVEGLLGPIAYIDLVGLDDAAAKERLLAEVKGERRKPTEAPTYPRAVAEEPAFPGALPPGFKVPLRRNPNFTGREALLDALREALTSGKAAALTQAIHGLGGVGKTQLALEYAYRHAADYRLVGWVRSEEAVRRASDYAALAAALGLPEKDAQDQDAIIQAVRACLETRGDWLLVFDNAPAPQALGEYLPRNPAGHVVVTSRYAAWRGVAKPLEVPRFPRPESVKFLLERTGSEDADAADAVADALGDLPLALEQAGAYAGETEITLSAYLDLFRKREAEMLARGKPSQEYPETVATTWLMAMEAARKKCPAAGDLLNLCAQVAPDDIPLDLLAEKAHTLPARLRKAAEDPLKRNKAVAALRAYSLCQVGREARTLSVHRLVQAVSRDRLDAKGRKRWAGAAVEVVNAAFPQKSQDVRTWDACARLLPHALAAGERAEALGAAREATGRALNQAGLYLKGRARFAEAKACFERAIKIDEATVGPDHPDVANCVNNLGCVLEAQGDLAGAKKCFERAIEIGEATVGSDHPDVATRVNNLGIVLWAQGDLAGAKKCIERAIGIDEKAYGKDHPEVAIRVSNLGLVLKAQGDLAGAKKCYERAIAIDEKAYGPDHPNVATGVNNLGTVLKAQGDLAGAKTCFERALAIDEKAYGPDHPNVARDVSNLGRVLQDQGDLAGAKKCFERAYRIALKFLGEDHPRTRLYRRNLEAVGGRP